MNTTKTTDSLHLIECTVGNESYGLDMSWVQTVQRINALLINTDAPDENAGFIGWLPSNDGDIPVFDMAYRLQRPFSMAVHNPQQRIIVLPSPAFVTQKSTIQSQPWGLLVDEVSQVLELSEDRLSPLPAIAANPGVNFFEGVVNLQDKLLLFLSPEWLHPDASPTIETTLPAEQTSEPFQPFDSDLRGTQLIERSLKEKGALTHKRMMMFAAPQPSENDIPLSFGLSIIQLLEVLESPAVTSIPTAPPYVLGLINWRNRPVPVIDLGLRLGLTSTAMQLAPAQMRFLIVHAGSQDSIVCFPVQSTINIVQLPIANRPFSGTLSLNRRLIHGIFDLEQRRLIIPNIKAISSRDG